MDTTITTLDCSQCMLGDYACFILRVRLFRRFPMLGRCSANTGGHSSVILHRNACIYSQETLSRNMTLRSLNLSHMGITDTGALALVDALTVNVSAEEVILR